MKRIISMILTVAVLLTFYACAAEKNTPSGNESGASQTTGATEFNATNTASTDVASVKGATFRVYSLKGPTSMGLVTLLRDSREGKTVNTYESNLCTAADEVTDAIVSGEADIALLPANAAATLFNKAGGFSVMGINTLGVLYVVENGDTVQSIEDLAGKTVCLTGKGTTPEYALRYLLAAHGIEDQVNLEFKSEAQEVVAAMTENAANIGVLPQPFATAAMVQNETLRQALDLTKEWSAVTQDSTLVTGVTVVRNEVLEQYPDQITAFLREQESGVAAVNAHPDEAAKLIEELGIVAKAPIAEKAIPFCNLVSITGREMKTLLSGYLQTLFEREPKSVGGAMPADNFYYTGE